MTTRRWWLVATLGVAAACGGGDEGGQLEVEIPPEITEAPESTIAESTIAESTAGEERASAPTSEPSDDGAEPDDGADDDAPAVSDGEADAAEDDVDGSTSDGGGSAGGGGDDGACLVGSWIVTEDELNAYYAALAGNTDTGDQAVDFSIVGDVLLDLDGTSYSYSADFELIIDVAGLEGTGVSSGSVEGTYAAADGIITTELGSSTLEVLIEVGGISLNGSDLADGLLTDAPINDAPFDCDGPTLSFQSGPDPSMRHDVTLTPA